MKKITTIFILLIVSITAWSQKGTDFYATIKKENYANLGVPFISQMEVAAKALDNCSKRQCTILVDPIKNKIASAKVQINLALSWGPYPPRSVQKSMVQFERQLLKSKKFPRKQLETAFKNYAGYSYSSMSSRMRFYIKSMEHMEDDE